MMFDPPIDPVPLLLERLKTIEARLSVACARSDRPRSAVTLVCVTKTTSAAVAGLLPGLGYSDLGESRPQELWHKAERIPAARWHMIGHLQRNKIDDTLPHVHLIHSVDSERLILALEDAASRQERTVPILLEVNASGEASKQGFAPDALPALVPVLRGLKRVQVQGLMTMAAAQEAEACRPTFARLRQLRDQLRAELAGQHPVEQLSMGMSNDFDVAVEEGATLVRLGSILFEGLP